MGFYTGGNIASSAQVEQWRTINMHKNGETDMRFANRVGFNGDIVLVSTLPFAKSVYSLCGKTF